MDNDTALEIGVLSSNFSRVRCIHVRMKPFPSSRTDVVLQPWLATSQSHKETATYCYERDVINQVTVSWLTIFPTHKRQRPKSLVMNRKKHDRTSVYQVMAVNRLTDK